MLIFAVIISCLALLGVIIDMFMGYQHMNYHKDNLKMCVQHQNALAQHQATNAVLCMMLVALHKREDIDKAARIVNNEFHDPEGLGAFTKTDLVDEVLAVIDEMSHNLNKEN